MTPTLVPPVLVTLMLASFMLLATPSAVAAQEEVPTVDLELNGSIETGPPSRGVSTFDVLEYRLTITNLGSVPLPAEALSLKVFVDNDSTRSNAEMEVFRFNGSDFRPLGICGGARTREILCTNRRIIEPEKSISVVVRHRHPEPLAGELRFFAELGPNNGGYVEPRGGLSNNGFSGPSYVFANPPTTTTTTAPPTTTTASTTSTTESTTSTTDPTTTTTDPDASTTTTDANGSSTTETTVDSSSTTAASSTSSTEATSTTEASTTTASTTTTLVITTSTTSTTAPPSSSSTASTSGLPITTIIASPSLIAPNDDSVEALRADLELSDADSALALGAGNDNNGGGPPYLWIVAGIAALALLGGIGLAAYTLYRPDPPLVDIRQWDQV
ncbi:MAG: hypothetical protein ACRBK7_02325 [Acidimicrobiales bacterium]